MACLAALTLVPFLRPLPVFAFHDAGEACYNCHTLDVDEGETGTAYISKTSRTLPRIKQYNTPVNTAPASLGCTYCHNDNGRTTNMKPAITHFQGRTSFHPVGYNFIGVGSETNNEYLSTHDSATTQELDCVDCHDLYNYADGRDDMTTTGVNEGTDGNAATSKGGQAGKYPEHGKPIDPVNNPYMLKSVTVAKEYDAFCRTCHRSDTAQTIKNGTLQLTAHADNAPGRPILENDGTVLRTADLLDGNGVADVSGLSTTAQCTYCHDTHYSMNRRLFNDGHEQHKTGGGMVDDTVVTSGDCTTLCHYAGDEKNSADGGNYEKHGHGMAQSTYKYKDGKPNATGAYVTMNYSCTACHVSIDPAQKSHADKYLSEPDQQVRYLQRFNLSGVMQSGDTGSAMGNPLVGVCLSCHQSYEDHKTVASGGVGCQDCHDEHAEGVGSTSNVMMIPEKAKKVGYYVTPIAAFSAKPGTETITYDSTKWDTATNPYTARTAANQDFFRQADANGMCDSTECHSGKGYTPLSGWIANPATTHSGGSQTAGADCNACHAHNGDFLGGWRAKDSCDDCHAANGRTHADSTKSQEMHDAHVASKYVTGCAMCHAHDGKSVQPLTGNHGVGGVVNFGGGSAKMTNAFDYADTFNTEANCSTAANGCHDADAAGEWAALSLGADACVDCHRSGVTKVLGTGTAPVSGLHNVTPTLTGQAHNEAITGGCAACHTVTALTTHKDGTLTGNGTVAGDRSNMGLGTLYTTSGADNSGTCAGTGASCHAGSPSLYRDDWRHEWNSTANYYTTATSACGGCHGDFANLWNSGSIHRTSATASSTHGGSGSFDCKDCHALEATTNSYTFGFGTTDWYPLNATSEHGNGSIEINSTSTGYNAASGLCTVCHTGADGVHNFADTTWPIVSIAGEGMSVACGSCHTAGVRPAGVSGAHALHLASQSALVDGGAACVDCHGNNGGSNYQMALSGTHGTGSVNFASVTYSATAQRGNVAGTCLTPSCHNRGTGTLQSTAWNSTQLDCDDCHFYAVSPTSALNTLSAANPRPISAVAHNDHFDNQKVCGHCHAVPAAGDTTHVNTSTTLSDMATALVDEGGVAFTDTAAVTDYTFNDTDNTCYSATNNGLGCHATGGSTGAADPTRPDWDASFLSTNCTGYCHTDNTTAAVNPVSGLHGVTPTLTGTAHDEAITGGCAACHTVTALATHQNGAFTGNGSVAGDRSSMGLGTFYTTGGADNFGTCAGTGLACHANAPTLYRDDWRHEWNSTAGYYTTASSACGGCHGDFANAWNTGAIHRTSVTAQSMHGGSGSFDCKDCHALEATTNSYTFGFGTSDWYPLNASSEHGNGSIEINNNSTSYNAASGLCTACHTSADGLHNFADTTWPIVAIAGEGMSISCGACHTGGTTPASASGAHTLHLGGTVALVAPGTACVECHGNNGGSNYLSTLSGVHGTGSVNFANVTYSASAQRGNVAGTCRTTSCHNRSTGTLQSTAWSTTALDCDDCHFYAASPTSALNNANPRPVSAISHNDHFDNQKVCGNCHAVPAAGDTTHVNTSTTLADRATALVDEALVAFTDTASVTDYTFNDTDNTCYSATNNGLGCHATGGSTGAADPTRPDWDASFLSTNCTGYCHTNHTTAAVNPVSGLHGVTPTITGQAHDESITTGCAACHAVTALASHQNGAFTGDGSVAGDRTSMGLGTFYTNTANNYGTCAGTGSACHNGTPSIYRDDWRHEWNSTAGYYSTASSACGGCHGDFANVWNAGVIHRTSVTAQSTHGGSGVFDCKDCHALEATTNNYTFVFGTADWYPLNATSEHGNGSIEINNNGTSYNATTGLCTACHTGSDGLHNFANTTWPIVSIAGEGMSVSCGSCHTGGTRPAGASGAHTLHQAGTVALVAPGTPCVECHGNNGGSNYQNSLSGVHGTGSVNFANVTYSATASRGNVSGTCVTTSCHNRSTGTLQSTAWNSTQLDCDDCHFYAVSPTSALNAANPRPVSAVAHNDHFDNQKVCGHCHAVPAAGDTTHVNTSTTLADRATALVDEGGVAFTDTAAVTDYTFNDTDNTCYSATNNGLGCHATGGSTGAADPTRPDWDTSFVSTNCTGYCHTNNTTAAVNPVSGLHGVTPTITGQAHDESITTGCAACHTVTALASHQNGAFTGDGSVSGDRTSMGLGTFYTTSGSNNSGTCSGTGASCHAGSPSLYRDDWAHVWDSTANYYTTAATACGGCHGDFANLWNAGVLHRTTATAESQHAGSGTFDCKDCHALEATTNSYTFGFGTSDWYPLNATSEHGNGSIEVNDNGTSYNASTGLCLDCHTSADGLHNFADTSWPIAAITGEKVGGCESCHGPSGPGPNVYGDGTLPGGDGGTPKPYDNGTWGFNVNGHGSNGTATNTPKDIYGDPYLVGNAACTACHDTSDPAAGAGRHNNGVLNSVELSQNQSTNTAHLIAAFVAGAASPEYDVQIKFDDVCYAKTGCHIAAMSHRHSKDEFPVLKAVRFGDGGTVADGESIAYPVDSDLTTNAGTGGEDFAVCISCHNPHGTSADEPNRQTNKMLRDIWVDEPNVLCDECHR